VAIDTRNNQAEGRGGLRSLEQRVQGSCWDSYRSSALPFRQSRA